MRDFAYKKSDFIKDDYVPELVVNHPCYQASISVPLVDITYR